MNEPRLRFKADDGSQFPDWEECTINDIFKFFNGKAHENIICEDGKYIVVNSKFISTDGMVKKYTDKMIFPLKKSDIVMVMSDVPNGKAMSKCFLIDKDDKYTLNQRICCLRTKENSIFFINQISRNKYFLKFDDGIKQTNLRKNDVLSCPVFRPCLAEQQKIAEFLSTIDTVIEKQKETASAWEERKRGVIEKLFSQEVRFKTDDGKTFPDWEEHKIKEFVTESKIPGHTGKEAKKLTVKLWAKGIIPKEQIISGSENTQYYIRHAGQLMYGKLDFLNCAFGIVPSELDGYESTLDSPAFDIHDISDKFLLSYITRKSFYKKNGDIANGSRKAKRIHPDVFGEMSINVPSLPEQQKIADCLSSLDEVIKKQKATLVAWEELKKGLLQQLFM